MSLLQVEKKPQCALNNSVHALKQIRIAIFWFLGPGTKMEGSNGSSGSGSSGNGGRRSNNVGGHSCAISEPDLAQKITAGVEETVNQVCWFCFSVEVLVLVNPPPLFCLIGVELFGWLGKLPCWRN